MQNFASESRQHIARISYPDMYLPVFDNKEMTINFVNDAEASDSRKLMHQVARMVWVGDKLEEVALGRPALQILFYLIAAEAASKIYFNFKGEGESKKYVRKFFTEICSADNQQQLVNGFSGYPVAAGMASPVELSLDKIVDFLYEVRCDVVHDGLYYMMALNTNNGEIMQQWEGNKEYRYLGITLSLPELRKIILNGGKIACCRIMDRNRARASYGNPEIPG